ncbi:MAG: MFS transporter [Cyclobacteriaceae bacterium]|jgi:maltose/moltooligosaccharide transporter|nr:MFS transporter [Cyclobacteriaceae bacterium]
MPTPTISTNNENGKHIKPSLKFWQIWNMSFGFLGVQFGFALQNANVSRILNDLGADLHSLSLFWLAAPVTGLIVQPIIGGASDHTWNWLGRRGPFILGGAIFATLGMVLMPNAPLFVKFIAPMVFGGIMFALMDGAFNVTMQPFRALVADMLPVKQRNLGYSVQSLLINFGAVIGSILPFLLTNIIGLDNASKPGEVAPTVVWSFYIGGTVLLGSVLWTLISTREYPPNQFMSFQGDDIAAQVDKDEKKENFLTRIITLIKDAPATMKQLALVQFFSWFALYIMWVYTTPAVGQALWGIDAAYYNMDKSEIPSDVLQKMGSAGDWVGILFAAYSLFAAIYSGFMGRIADKLGRKLVYSLSLLLGGLGYISILIFKPGDTITVNLLFTTAQVPQGGLFWLLSMMAVGIAWAAILAMPYAILSNALPKQKMGIYMGIFNFTIAGPQIVSGLLGGWIISGLFSGNAISMLVISGVCMILGAASVIFVKDVAN